jgi:hypothetical protein
MIATCSVTVLVALAETLAYPQSGNLRTFRKALHVVYAYDKG